MRICYFSFFTPFSAAMLLTGYQKGHWASKMQFWQSLQVILSETYPGLPSKQYSGQTITKCISYFKVICKSAVYVCNARECTPEY